MSKDDDEDEKKDNRPNHTGSVAAEDAVLTGWLNRLWARNEPPERVELWQMFGRNKAIRGEMIFHQDFKHNEKLSPEHANKLANEILESAQNDCDSLRRETHYQLAIIDRNRKSTPLIRRIGPVHPMRTYAIARAGDSDTVDDANDDETPDAKSIELRYIHESHEQAKWDKQRYDTVMGQMLMLQNNIVQNQQAVLDRMFNQQVSFFEKLQEAQDRSLDRELVRKREELKRELLLDGFQAARNLLPGLFAGSTAGKIEKKSLAIDENEDDESKEHTSPERILVSNFLGDCEKKGEAFHIKLFGDFEEKEGKLVQVKPGIFTVKQYAILLGVRDGRLTPEALDELNPEASGENAITEEQTQKAQAAGVTTGMGIALAELLALRRRAATSRETSKENQPNNEKDE